MTRTRFREDQGIDADFLSETEGGERFLFKEGYGTNLNIKSDGYLSLKDLGTDPTAPTGSDLLFYNKGGDLYYKSSSATQTPLSLTQGIFTPDVRIGGTGQSVSYAIGHYTKAGNLATVAISVSFTLSGSGSLTIQSLPFSAKNISNLQQGLNVSRYEGFTIANLFGRVNSIVATIEPNETTLRLKRMAGDSGVDISDTNLSASVVLVITGTYLTN